MGKKFKFPRKYVLVFPKEDIVMLRTLARIACNIGTEAYVVGGYVRDLLLKRSSKDIDVVCVGPNQGPELAQEFADHVQSHAQIFKTFGTAQVQLPDYVFEFVTARKESYPPTSRKPNVQVGTLVDDLRRRDFTCNSLAIPLKDFQQASPIDLFNGIDDTKRGVLRTPLAPQETLSDDPLRMMRAVRFAAQLKFSISEETLQAMQQTASRLSIVSQERITDELNKLLLSSSPSIGIRYMEQTGLLTEVLPELLRLRGVEVREGRGHKENFLHTLKVLDNVAQVSDNLWLRWAALLHDIAKPDTKAYDTQQGWTFHGHEELGARRVAPIFKRLGLPQRHIPYVKKLVRLHLRPIALVKDEATDSAVRRLLYEAGEAADDLMTLCRADITSKDSERVRKYMNNFDIVERKMRVVEEKDRLRNFQPPVWRRDYESI